MKHFLPVALVALAFASCSAPQVRPVEPSLSALQIRRVAPAPQPARTEAPGRAAGSTPEQTQANAPKLNPSNPPSANAPARVVGFTPEQMKAAAPKSSLNEPPSAENLAAADYGSAPSEDREAQVRTAMAELLKDPDSAKYRFTAPEKSWLPRYHFDEHVDGQPYQHGSVFGWTMRFGVNAKNGFGGYGGEKAYEAFFKDGHLTGILERGKYKDIFGFPTWDLVASVRKQE